MVSLGATGVSGVPGQQGATGFTGLPGQRGTSGATGATGPRGGTGTSGATGFTGLPGICPIILTSSIVRVAAQCLRHQPPRSFAVYIVLHPSSYLF